MEDWQLDYEWLKVRHRIKDKFSKEELPDLNAILFLIGIQEVGQQRKFSKEEKQDLMHVAVCTLLAKIGMYEKVGTDDEGWPHFELIKQLTPLSREEQEEVLKEQVVLYFDKNW